MTSSELRQAWLHEEAIAHMRGWDFSHLQGRYTEGEDYAWDYAAIVRSHLSPDKTLLDMGTGGGEFLLTLGHPPAMTTVTEGYPPNAALCRERLAPLGIRVVEADGEDPLPLPDNAFDLVINRHESYLIPEVWRVLKPGGLFITQQVGEDNDRALAELLLPGLPKPFPGLNAAEQSRRFAEVGFTILRQEEGFQPIRFFDVGALVWFARICPWEFPGFSVEGCLDRLMEAQRILEQEGELHATAHRFLLVARK